MADGHHPRAPFLSMMPPFQSNSPQDPTVLLQQFLAGMRRSERPPSPFSQPPDQPPLAPRETHVWRMGQMDGRSPQDGQRGPTGVGIQGPTGIGETGPTGRSITGPTGKTGVGRTGPTGRGYTGPTGFGVTGPTGRPGSATTGAQGIQGPPGPTGPKDSIVQTPRGIFAFACIEGARPWFVDIVAADADLRGKFAAAVLPETAVRFRSACGKFDLVAAVRQGFEQWDMPERSAEQMARATRFWGGAR